MSTAFSAVHPIVDQSHHFSLLVFSLLRLFFFSLPFAVAYLHTHLSLYLFHRERNPFSCMQFLVYFFLFLSVLCFLLLFFTFSFYPPQVAQSSLDECCMPRNVLLFRLLLFLRKPIFFSPLQSLSCTFVFLFSLCSFSFSVPVFLRSVILCCFISPFVYYWYPVVSFFFTPVYSTLPFMFPFGHYFRSLIFLLLSGANLYHRQRREPSPRSVLHVLFCRRVPLRPITCGGFRKSPTRTFSWKMFLEQAEKKVEQQITQHQETFERGGRATRTQLGCDSTNLRISTETNTLSHSPRQQQTPFHTALDNNTNTNHTRTFSSLSGASKLQPQIHSLATNLFHKARNSNQPQSTTTNNKHQEQQYISATATTTATTRTTRLLPAGAGAWPH